MGADGAIRHAAAATPADRDRFADALRVGSLFVVIAGHWFMVVVTSDGGIGNALAYAPSLQPLTWALQVMPLFFLVGGVAHAHTLDRVAPAGAPPVPGRYASFVTSRAHRLLRPTAAFLAVWLGLGAVAHLTGLTAGPSGTLAVNALAILPQLLWFVGVYLGVAACAPVMYRMHRRFGWPVFPLLVALAALTDLARFAAGWTLLGNLNFLWVWLAVHQLGFWWRDGVLTRPVGALLLAVGAAGLLAAVAWGPYPVSMVGMPGAEVSNMAPPSLALLAQGTALVGVAALVRTPASRLLARAGVWRGVVAAGAFAMTAFLWHLSALLATLVAMRKLGIDQPAVLSGTWWLTRPVWFAVLAVPTAALVALFRRFDAGPPPGPLPAPAPRRSDPLAAIGVVVTIFGVLMIAMVGVDVLGARPVFFLVGDVTPAVALTVLLAGCALLYASRLPVTPAVHATADEPAA